jgi:large subunit ribosomal protein L17
MNKKVFGKKLSRDSTTRRALFRSLVRAMAFNGQIVTTKAKAVAVRGQLERLVSLSSKDGVASRRRLYAELGNDRETADKLVDFTKKAFTGKNSGFTRIIRLPARRGDRAEMVRFEWTVKPEGAEKSGAVKTAKKSKKEGKVEAKADAGKGSLKDRLGRIRKGKKSESKVTEKSRKARKKSE